MLKVAVSGDFWHFLFHKSNPSGLLINRFNKIILKIRFRGGIREISESSQANTVQSQTFCKVAVSRDFLAFFYFINPDHLGPR